MHEGIRPEHARPMRSETRARLVAAIARGRRWLDELIADPSASADSIESQRDRVMRRVKSAAVEPGTVACATLSLPRL